MYAYLASFATDVPRSGLAYGSASCSFEVLLSIVKIRGQGAEDLFNRELIGSVRFSMRFGGMSTARTGVPGSLLR